MSLVLTLLPPALPHPNPQKQHAAVLPELEARLCSTADAIVGCVMGGPPASGAADAAPGAAAAGHAGGSAAHVVQRVVDTVAAVEAAEAANQQLAREVAATAAGYLERLREMQGLLQGMLAEGLLGSQRQLDEVRLWWCTRV